MVLNYNLEKIAGPSGTFAGYVLLVFGFITSIFTWTGIIVLLAGIILAFGYNCTKVDSEKRSIQNGIKVLLWQFYRKAIIVDDSFKLEMKHVKSSYSVYSAGNRKLKNDQTDYRIYISSNEKFFNVFLAKFADQVDGQNEIQKISDLIKVEIKV